MKVVEHDCYRCGSNVEDQAPFCPACGAPQIRVPSRQPQAEIAQEPVPPPPPPTGPIAASPTHVYPGQIHWKAFLRMALPLAALAGVASAFLGVLGWLLLAGIVFLSIRRYRRVRPGPLTASQGARMGLAAALLSSAFFAVLFAGEVAANPAVFRAQMEKANQRMAGLNLDPEGVRMAQEMLSGTRGLVLLTLTAVFVTIVFLVIFGSVAGAVAAGWSSEKGP